MDDVDDVQLDVTPAFDLVVPSAHNPRTRKVRVEGVDLGSRHPKLTCVTLVPQFPAVFAGRYVSRPRFHPHARVREFVAVRAERTRRESRSVGPLDRARWNRFRHPI